MFGRQGDAYAQLVGFGKGYAGSHQGLVLLFVRAVIGQPGVAGQARYLFVDEALLVEAISHALLHGVGVYAQGLQHVVAAEPDLFVGEGGVGFHQIAVVVAGREQGGVGEGRGAGAGAAFFLQRRFDGLVVRDVVGARAVADSKLGVAADLMSKKVEGAAHFVVHVPLCYIVVALGTHFVSKVHALVCQRGTSNAAKSSR